MEFWIIMGAVLLLSGGCAGTAWHKKKKNKKK